MPSRETEMLTMQTLRVGSIVEGNVVKVGRNGMRVALPGGECAWVPLREVAAPTQILREDVLYETNERLLAEEPVVVEGQITADFLEPAGGLSRYQLSPLRLARVKALEELQLGVVYCTRIVAILEGRMTVQLNEYHTARLSLKHMVGSRGEREVRLLNHIEGYDKLEVALTRRPTPNPDGTATISVSEVLAKRLRECGSVNMPTVGQSIVGTITRLDGANVRLELPDGIEGIVTELGNARREQLQLGQSLRVDVIAVHPSTLRATVAR